MHLLTMSLLDYLPSEVLRAILSFMDISSLAALSATQRPQQCNISFLASDDKTWYALVQRRFGIGCTSRRRQSNTDGVVLIRRDSSSLLRKKRPMSYGGSTWKQAYRSLSSTMRIPETSVTNSTVFASPSRYRFQTSGHRTAYSRRGRDKNPDYLGIWCLVNHAENCRTKTVKRGVANSSGDTYNHDRRFIELKICLQNTKSGYGCITIPDIRHARFVTLNEEECFVSSCGNDVSHESLPNFPVVCHGLWAPKVLLRTRFIEDQREKIMLPMNTKDIVLHPLELIVLSIHLSCPSDMLYETDVLSTLSSIRVPYETNRASSGLATAHFFPEDLLWEYYCQLPGGCLSLIDRSRLIQV